MTSIRDFIYLDIERLYSLYSQVFEGVADQIIQSYIDTLQSTDTQRTDPFLQASDIETKVVEVSRRTENKFLYDHMYNKLERVIEDSILDATIVTKENYIDIIEESFFVKVSGNAEIEDFDSIKELFEQFNFLGEALFYISNFNPIEARTVEKQIDQFRAQVENTTDKNKKIRVQRDLERALSEFQQNLRDQALAGGLGYDKKFLEYLAELTARYYPDRLDVTVTPDLENDPVSFRGVLDKRWLRLSPEFLRHLYSGTASGWTLVGQITHLPDESAEIDETDAVLTESPEASNMRSAFNNIIKHFYSLEKHFTTNVNKVEIIISPLAIYREVLISNKSEENNAS